MDYRKLLPAVLFISASAIMVPSYAADGKEGSDDLHKLTNANKAVDSLASEKLGERAFEVLMEQMYPTSPEQINQVQESEKKREEALYDNKAPTALTDIIQVSTVPGTQPSTVIVSPLHTTTLNVVDSTGKPWPIAAVISGNELDYTIESVDAHKYKNVIRITPLREIGSTNVILALADLPTTVTLNLHNSGKAYHPAPIIQLDRAGPHAKQTPAFSIASVNSDDILKGIVLGVAPTEYRNIKTSDPAVEAWRHKGSLFLRTNYMPTSPLPRGIYHGPSGYAAYKMADIPLVVMSDENDRIGITM